MPSTGPFADPHGSIQIECMPFTSNSNFGAKASRALIFLQPMASQLVFPVKKHVIRNTGTSFHHAGTSAAIPADSTILPNISAACFMPLPTFVSSSTLSSSVVQNNGHRRQEISLFPAAPSSRLACVKWGSGATVPPSSRSRMRNRKTRGEERGCGSLRILSPLRKHHARCSSWSPAR